MRTIIALFLAAYVVTIPAPQNQFPSSPFADAGADADDSWPIGEIAETATLVVDRIQEARKFLADLSDDNFDFQQWYDEQLDDFVADQDNVAYDNDDDRQDDYDDFVMELNEISTEFASSQGEDYANFVRDIIGEGIDHLHEQAEELLERLQETANDLNDLEEQEFDLYIQMTKIACVLSNQNALPILSTGSPDIGTPGSWPDKLTDKPGSGDQYVPLGGPDSTTMAPRTSCALDQVREELNEAYRKYNAATTSATKTKQRTKVKKYQKKYRDYVRKWQKLQHTYLDVQQKEDHEYTEYTEYEFLLSAAQGLQQIGMQGSDFLVLPDGRIPTPTP